MVTCLVKVHLHLVLPGLVGAQGPLSAIHLLVVQVHDSTHLSDCRGGGGGGGRGITNSLLNPDQHVYMHVYMGTR